MEKASGVYLTITDESISAAGGTQELKVVVPMLTTKGKLGFNKVTAKNYRDVIGYDMKYNSNYYGLSKILETVQYAYVWRLNQNSKLANAYFADKESEKAFNSDAETIEDVTMVDPKPLITVGHTTTGEWQNTAIKFYPTAAVVTESNKNPSTGNAQTIEFESISSTEKMKFGEIEDVLASCVFYNSSDNSVVAIIKDEKVYKVVDGEVGDTEIGTAIFDDEKLTIVLNDQISKDSFWNIHTIPASIENWTMVVANYDGRNYSVKNEFEFSFDTDSDIYIDKVNFGDIFLSVNGSIPSDMNSIRSYFLLEGGSNGDSTIVPIDMDTSVLDNCGCNVIAMNGLTEYKIVNRLASKLKPNKIHLFADAPAYDEYINVEQWSKKIANSEYIAIGARPDTSTDSDGKLIYIYPSVNYVAILSSMLTNYGFLNYPPAGPTYGLISTEDLMDCDYEMYANELKTNRINWQRTNNVGTMMWEQRTTYALDSDLSYIAPVFIVDAVAEAIVSFEQNYNFRYMTPTDILNQQSGLNSILQDYVDKNFLYSFDIQMPTYEEAQKAGRTLEIPIEIVIMKDAEVININLILTNAK